VALGPVRKTLIALGALLAAAQLVPITRNNPAVRGDLAAPATVKNIVRRACYNCHSNETRWPWYSALAPASWLIVRDVNEGRCRLNFSNWADYASDPGTKAQKLREIAKMVGNNEMAPWYYRMIYRDARMAKEQREALIRWARSEENPGAKGSR
jgi:hypothetical protein